MGNEVLSINGLFPAGGKLTLFKMDTGEKIELADSKTTELRLTPSEDNEPVTPIPDAYHTQVEFTMKLTHKQVRQWRKEWKGIHKPRLPRKVKKQIKKWIICQKKLSEHLM